MPAGQFKLRSRTNSTSVKTHSYCAILIPFLKAARCLLTVLVAATLASLLFAATPHSALAAQSPNQIGEKALNLQKTQLVRPGDLKSGALLFKSTAPGKFVPAPLLATDVRIEITGIVARVKVSQRFYNPSDGWVEGLYTFPLPEKSAVDTLKMQIGDRFIEGVIKVREEARKIYEKARRQGKKASLVEQQRPNIFTNEVANIGPGEAVTVQIEYQQSIRRDGNRYGLRFPMVVGPRYFPDRNRVAAYVSDPQGQSADPEDGIRIHQKSPDLPDPTVIADTAESDSVENTTTIVDGRTDQQKLSPPYMDPRIGKINPLSLQVSLKAGFALGEIKSAHHEVFTRKTDSESALIGLKDGHVPADKDFELNWWAVPGDQPQATLYREHHEGNDYVLAMISPQKIDPAKVTLPREVVFVIDNSGSMAGQSIGQAKRSLLLALDRLKAEDRFNIIRFDDSLELVFDKPVQATEKNIEQAKSFVSVLTADGGTEMLPALAASLKDPDSENVSVIRQVIFLTDGAIGNEAEMFREIAANRGRSQIFTVGIGSAPNTYFMNRAAELGRGAFTHIGSPSQVMNRMTDLFKKLELPAMQNLTVSWPETAAAEFWPNPLPDLYAGEPVILVAKLSGVDGDLQVSGTYDGQKWEQTLSLGTAKVSPGIAKLWARNKIASLEADRYRLGSRQELDKSVERLGLAYNLVSRRTSLVAVDVSPSRAPGDTLSTRNLPLNLPAGWDFDKVFGKDLPTRIDKNLVQEAEVKALNKLMKVAENGIQVRHSANPLMRKVLLPQASTQSDQKILIGMLCLLFAAMSGITIFFWRQLRTSSGVRRSMTRRPIS